MTATGSSIPWPRCTEHAYPSRRLSASSGGSRKICSSLRSSSAASSPSAPGISSSQVQHGAVHQPELVQVAAGHHQLVADPQAAAADRLAQRVERVAQRAVERVDPELALVHGREHLDVLDCVDAVVLRQPPAHQLDDQLERLTRARALHQEEVVAHALVGLELRRLAAADRVRALHDHAARRLPEDVAQARCRHHVGGDQVGERLAGSDRSQLIRVAHQHHVRARRDRLQQRHHQLEVRHRGLVDDQQVVGQRIVLVVLGQLTGHPAERRVDRLGVDAARLGHPPRRPAGRRDQQHLRALTLGRAWRSCGSTPSCRCRDRP